MKKPKYLLNVNQLFLQLMETLEKLENGEISVPEAVAISKLHNTAQGWIHLELKRSLKNIKELPE